MIGYMKAVKTKMAEKGADADAVAAFEKGAGAYAKKIVANFKDFDFYTGESMDPDAMYVLPLVRRLRILLTDFGRVVLMNYRDDGVTPYVIIWKHGLSEMKV